jgi:TRAP-type C4-dicarboxylate transport system substrate-binding protein
VTIKFTEVYPSLQRGVADCAITSPTSGNTGKWPEVTTHLLPVSVAGSVQGHFITLDKWNSFTPEQQAALEEEFEKLEDDLWELASTLNTDATNCNTGAEPCEIHEKFSMTLVEVSPTDQELVREAANAVVLSDWGEKCNAIEPRCAEIWNETVGAARGFTIPGS